MSIVASPLSVGAGSDTQDEDGRTPLHAAAEAGEVDTVRSLLRETSVHINAKDKTKHRTPLHLAARNGHVAVMKVLLEAMPHADIDARDKDDWTPLHLAARCGHDAIAQVLLAATPPADIAIQDKIGQTPLHLAAAYGRLQVVRLLILFDKSVAEFAQKDKTGTTALHLAAWWGHFHIVKELIKHRASINQQDDHKRDALHFAAREYLDGSSDPNRSQHGMIGSQNRWRDIVEYLLMNGADFASLDKHLANRLLKKFRLAPSMVNGKEFRGAMDALSIVAILFASLAYVGWLNPPGGFLNGATMLDAEGIGQCSASVNSDAVYPGRNACNRYQHFLLAFFVFNSLAFSCSIAAVIAAVMLKLPASQSNFFTQARANRSNFRFATGLLCAALLCGLVAFNMAAFAVMPDRHLAWTIATAALCFIVLVVTVRLLSETMRIQRWIEIWIEARLAMIEGYMDGYNGVNRMSTAQTTIPATSNTPLTPATPSQVLPDHVVDMP